MEKVIYFGVGQLFSDSKEQIMYLNGCENVCCLGIMDNNSELWGKEIAGKEIMCPQKVEECDYYLITTIKYYEEVKTQLQEIYHIEPEKIESFGAYFRRKYAKEQYAQRTLKKEKNIFDTKKIIVYSCIIGDYDGLKTPQYVSDDIKYVCFTDNKKIVSDVWNIVYIEQNYGLDNIRLARYIKLFPDIFLEDEGTSVWVDAKYEIRDDLRDYIKMYGGEEKILCFPHPERDCIYQEGEACIKYGRVSAEDMYGQLKTYANKGYPSHNGLYDTGCIVRLHGDKQIQELMKKWWEEIKRYTYRDQISFPFVCDEMHITPDICDLDINMNRWLQVYKHN